LLNSN
jgi:hypothetical protein